MSMYRKQWDCCGDVSETDGWEPESCLFCTTPPSPSTAPEAWVYECKQPGDDKDKWAEFFSRNKPSDAPYIRNARPLYGAAIVSRPAEVDDEGLPGLPESKFCAWLQNGQVVNAFTHGVGEKARWDHDGHWASKGYDRAPLYTAEQYRQGQRDAVAADRARREKGGV